MLTVQVILKHEENKPIQNKIFKKWKALTNPAPYESSPTAKTLPENIENLDTVSDIIINILKKVAIALPTTLILKVKS